MIWFGKNKSGSTAPSGPGANPGTQQQDFAPSSAERTAAWDRALGMGTLPPFVETRLKDAACGKIPWLSTMTPAELLLARSHGIRPVATVSGTCCFHYGYSWTKGHEQGWHTAIDRIKYEAQLAGANAIVDVKLRRPGIALESSMDFTVIGTAVKIDGLEPSSDPIVATVPALEFIRLLEAGIVPVGIAVGAEYSWLNPRSVVDGSWSAWNRPLPTLGNFWERVRRKALSQMADDAAQSGNGVLAHTHFGQLLRFEGDQNTPTRFLGRHIVMGTIVDTGSSRDVPHEIRTIIDMRDGPSPFLEANRTPRNDGPIAGEGGEI